MGNATLFILGLNHRTAPVAVRERLAVYLSCLGEAAEVFKCVTHFDEIVLLSTTNRFEISATLYRSSPFIYCQSEQVFVAI